MLFATFSALHDLFQLRTEVSFRHREEERSDDVAIQELGLKSTRAAESMLPWFRHDLRSRG
jgi:hypothetical protein